MSRPAFEPNVGVDPTDVNAGNGQALSNANRMAATAGRATAPGTITGNDWSHPISAGN